MKRMIYVLLLICLIVFGCKVEYEPSPPKELDSENVEESKLDSSYYNDYLSEEELTYTGLAPPCNYMGEWCVGVDGDSIIIISKSVLGYAIPLEIPLIDSTSIWRIPNRREAQIIRMVSPPWWNWNNKRYICTDDNKNYYSFKFGGGGNISACGEKTKYYIKLIKKL